MNRRIQKLKTKLRNIIKNPYTYSGWGFKTYRQLAWDCGDNTIFNITTTHIKNNFTFLGQNVIRKENFDNYLWRHWIISFCAQYVKAHTTCKTLVECGVCDGISAYYTLSELDKSYTMHLYDAWGNYWIENYKKITIENVKKNLCKYEPIYHDGLIPLTLDNSAPTKISYLHIDLNSAEDTLECLKFFYPRIVNNGIILFDDYGSMLYQDTKSVVDKFMRDKKGLIMPQPTGQMIYFVRK